MLIFIVWGEEMIFDKAFINGKVYTMENPYTVAEAMLVHDGKIFETGTTQQISKYDVTAKNICHNVPVLKPGGRNFLKAFKFAAKNSFDEKSAFP